MGSMVPWMMGGEDERVKKRRSGLLLKGKICLGGFALFSALFKVSPLSSYVSAPFHSTLFFWPNKSTKPFLCT